MYQLYYELLHNICVPFFVSGELMHKTSLHINLIRRFFCLWKVQLAVSNGSNVYCCKQVKWNTHFMTKIKPPFSTTWISCICSFFSQVKSVKKIGSPNLNSFRKLEKSKIIWSINLEIYFYKNVKRFYFWDKNLISIKTIWNFFLLKTSG